MYAAGHNLGVIMPKLFGLGTPRSLQTEGKTGLASLSPPLRPLAAILSRVDRIFGTSSQMIGNVVASRHRDCYRRPQPPNRPRRVKKGGSPTGRYPGPP